MRIFLQTALVAALALPLSSVAFAGANDLALCTRMTQGWQTAYHAKDAAKVAGMYEASGSLYSNAFWTAKGRQAIEGGLRQEIAGGTHFSDIKCTDAYRSGDLLVGKGTYAASAPGPDGKTMDVTGHWLSSVKEDHGKYLIVDHTSNMQLRAPH